MRRCSGLLLMFTLTATLPAPVRGQLQITARAASISVGGRLHVQYSRSSADGGVDAVDDVLIRRARINLDLRIGDVLDARVVPDFGGGGTGAGLADGWARLTLAPAVRLSVGQFKRAFSGFELASSTDLPVIERDGRVEGVSGCPGVGGVCTFARLTERLQFDDRDLGVRAEGRLGERVDYVATITNGEGRNAADVNDAKSASGRIVLGFTDDIRVAGFAATHDFVAADGTERAQAFGADVEVGSWRDGFHLLAAVATGDNWMAGPGAGFATVLGLASLYLPLAEGGRFAGVEPMLRTGWTATENASGTGFTALVLTPGISLYVAGKNWVGVNLDWYDPKSGGPEWSFKTQAFVYF